MGSRCSTSCLGHADQRTAEVTCTRCSGTYYIPVPYIPLNARGRAEPARDLREPDGYTCLRCRKVLRGDRDVKDPLASEAQMAAVNRRQIATTSPQNSLGATQGAGGES